MKRILACLLMLLLPFQSAWAVAAAFCGNAVVSVAIMADDRVHHGHAEHHEHYADAADPIEETAQTNAECNLPDGHCAACHSGCAAVTATALPTVAGADNTPDNVNQPPLVSPARQRPERPKWHGFA